MGKMEEQISMCLVKKVELKTHGGGICGRRLQLNGEYVLANYGLQSGMQQPETRLGPQTCFPAAQLPGSEQSLDI